MVPEGTMLDRGVRQFLSSPPGFVWRSDNCDNRILIANQDLKARDGKLRCPHEDDARGGRLLSGLFFSSDRHVADDWVIHFNFPNADLIETATQELALDCVQMINKQNAVQMIYFMKDDTAE